MSISIINSPSSVLTQTNELHTYTEQFLKCGDIFLDTQFCRLVYLCSYCCEQFTEIELFSKHISDVHLVKDEASEISWDDLERVKLEGEGNDQKADELIKGELIDYTDESTIDGAGFQSDTANTVLDIELYDEEQQNFEDDFTNQEAISTEFSEVDGSDINEYKMLETIVEHVSPEQMSEVEYGENTEEAPFQGDKEKPIPKYKCQYCDEKFELAKELKKHDCNFTKQEKVHPCPVCRKVFKKKSGLDIHKLIHSGQKPHKCDICGSAYACKQNLIVHIRRHTGEKPFQCDYCERKFASSTEKVSHTRVHTGERPFVCEMCGKAHASSSQLNEHMHRHLDIRNHPCDICNKRFRNSYNLRMHKLIHENAPRKFPCEYCMSAFKTNNNLLQHMKIHQKVKKYVCRICGRAFAQHPGLYIHMKSHGIIK